MTKLNSINDPFFIFCDGRSGSTYLANLLTKKTPTAIPPESNFFTRILKNYNIKLNIDNEIHLKEITKLIWKEPKFQDWAIDENAVIEFFNKSYPVSLRELLLGIFKIYMIEKFPESMIFGIKKGSYAKFYHHLKELFPNSKLILLTRDGRAVFNSKKSSINSRGEIFESNPYKAANSWCRVRNLMRNIKKQHKKTLILHYENFVLKPEETIELIANFLEIPSNEKSLNEKQIYKIPERYGLLHKNIDKNPIKNRINAWKNSLTKDEIFVFESIAHDYLLKEGYELIYSKKSLSNPLRHFLVKIKNLEWWFPEFKEFYLIPFNHRRITKLIKNFIKLTLIKI